MTVRLAIICAIWKRPELTEITLRYVSRLRVPGVEILGIAVGSEGKRSKALARRCGWEYVEAPNEPLSDKHNAALPVARDWGADAVIVMGSDDLLGGTYWERAAELVRSGVRVWTQRGLYLYDPSCQTLVFSPKLRPGLGMMISRRVLDRYSWQIWPPGLEAGLDQGVHQRIIRNTTHWHRTWHAEREGVVAVDIKTDLNMNSFRDSLDAKNGYRTIADPKAWFDRHFPGVFDALHPNPEHKSETPHG